MAFLEVQFPTKLALMAQGGPLYSTTVNAGFAGYEQRNQNWSASRGEWTVGFEHKTQADYDYLQGLFHATRGMANGFRLKDHADFQCIGEFQMTGDGHTTTLQLQKTYSFPISEFELVRPIQKPITSLVKDFAGNALTDTVTLYDNGGSLTHHAGYTTLVGGYQYKLDYTTGIVTFATAPAAGHIITADFQYHFPVRFDLDDLKRTVETPEAAGLIITVTGINLKEIRILLGQSAG